jgi:hypothetical protein
MATVETMVQQMTKEQVVKLYATLSAEAMKWRSVLDACRELGLTHYTEMDVPMPLAEIEILETALRTDALRWWNIVKNFDAMVAAATASSSSSSS